MNNNLFENWQDFAVFHCKGNTKIPATQNGFKDALCGQDVREMLQMGYNAAVACEKSHIVVIDIDYYDKNSTAMEDLHNLEEEFGAKLPKTLTQSTASGNGRHLIYSSKGITNPRGKIGKFCDVKYRGYIMIAPSIINGKKYEIIDGIDENGKFIIAELPQKWLDYINKGCSTNQITPQAKTSSSKHKIYTNIDIEKMFNNCAFLKHCQKNADCLSEPEWFTMINILAHIENSDELIHELSEPYPTYSFAETQKKIENARSFGFPQSCKYISKEYSEICKDCISAEREVKND